jgi:hypothetical protein
MLGLKAAVLTCIAPRHGEDGWKRTFTTTYGLRVDSGDARIVSGVRRFYGHVEWNREILIKNKENVVE